MIRRLRLAHFANAPGAFYVVQGKTCEAAPGLIESDSDGCFFSDQPRTAAELDQALKLTIDSGGAVRYAGADRDILQRLRKAGAAETCDAATMPDLRESLPARLCARLIARIPAFWLLALGQSVAVRLKPR